MMLLTLRAWWKEFVRKNIVADYPENARQPFLRADGPRHEHEFTEPGGRCKCGMRETYYARFR